MKIKLLDILASLMMGAGLIIFTVGLGGVTVTREGDSPGNAAIAILIGAVIGCVGSALNEYTEKRTGD